MALVVKNLPTKADDIRDAGSIPGSGRSFGGGHSNLLQYACLENPMDRGAWRAMIHRVAKSWTQLKQLRMHKLIFKCLWRNKGSYTAKSTLKEKVKEMRGFPNSIFRYPKKSFQ